MQNFLSDLLKQAGSLALEYFRKGVSYATKSNPGDLVSEGDRAISDFLIKRLNTEFPDYGIQSEEEKEVINPNSTRRWVIDPIDGTRNFAMGVPFWCVMAALVEGAEPLLSGVYAPISGDLFIAEQGKGAFRNGIQVTANTNTTLEHSFGVLICDHFGVERALFKKAIDNFDRFSGWRMNYGTMLASLYVASGGVDLFVNNCGYDHDYLAPALICSEAGAVVSTYTGKPWTKGRRDIVISAPGLHQHVIALFG